MVIYNAALPFQYRCCVSGLYINSAVLLSILYQRRVSGLHRVYTTDVYHGIVVMALTHSAALLLVL